MTKTEGTRSALRQALSFKDFRNLVIANGVSETGDWAYNVALLVYVFDVTHSAGWVAIAGFFRLLPSMVVTPFAGVLADRYERRAVMMWSAGLGSIVMGLLAVLAATTESAIGAIALAFTCNAVLTPYRPAVTAITPSVLPERSLAAGNSILTSISYVAIALGPALGGVVLIASSPAVAFGINSLSFLGAVLVLTRVKARSKPTSEERASEGPRLIGEFREGMKATFQAAEARVLVFLMAVASFLYGTEIVTFVVYSQERLGLGPDGVTYLMAAIGVGGSVGATFTSRIGTTAKPGRFLWVSAFLSGGALIAISLVTVPVVSYVIITLDGAGAILADVVCLTLLQRTVSQRLLGRVFGAVDALAVAGILLGSLITPFILELLGIRMTLVATGLMVPLFTLLVSPSIRRLDQKSADRKAELDGLVQLLAHSRLMEGAPRQALELVAGQLEAIAVPTGTAVVVQGDEAENLYVIRAGEVSVTKRDASGASVPLATLGPGDYFGEIGVLENKPRMASVETSADSELLKIKGDDFLVALEMCSVMAGRLSGTIASRLAEAEVERDEKGPEAA